MVNFSCGGDHEYCNGVCIYCGFIEGEEEEVNNKIMKEKPTNTWELAEKLEYIAKVLKKESAKQQGLTKAFKLHLKVILEWFEFCELDLYPLEYEIKKALDYLRSVVETEGGK